MRYIKTITEGKTINEQSGLATDIIRSTSSSLSLSASYSFSSPTGIKLPLLGRIKFESRMTTSVEITYNKSQDKRASPTGNYHFNLTSDRSDLTIRPTASYNFSTTVNGGIQARWQDTNDALTGRKSHTRELSLFVEMRF